MSKDETSEVVKKSLAREIAEWVGCILAAFIVAIVIKYFIFTPTLVQQGSMTPTILNDERVLINRLVRTFKLDLHRGDIITFESPMLDAEGHYYTENQRALFKERSGIMDYILCDLLEVKKMSYIKRVIGLAGDHVFISEDGDVYINNGKLEEPYLQEGLETPRTGSYYDVVVPEGYIFVMGDNRGGSSDSREFGCIPLEKVEGRVKYRIWPLSKFGAIDE